MLVGGGYATGRELVEFFLRAGPATGLVGFAVTAGLFSLGAMISFELARRFQAFDYRRFCRVYLGRWWWLFEVGYAVSLLLVLSVVCAASGKLLVEFTPLPPVVNSALFIAVVAILVTFGNSFIERLISLWSVLFYATYGLLLVFVLARFGPQVSDAVTRYPIDWSSAAWNGLSYTGYNIPLLPILIFVARHFRSRSEAVTAGALIGPLVLAPGIAFLIALSAFYPAIKSSALPVTDVLARIGEPWLDVTARLVILGALVKTGAGLLHGLNERIAGTMDERETAIPVWLRPAAAGAALVLAVYVGDKVGLIDLIGRGYRYISLYFIAVFVGPLLTVGLYKLVRSQPVEPSPAPYSQQAAE